MPVATRRPDDPLYEPRLAPDVMRTANRLSEVFGSGAAMKSLNEQLRASALAGNRLSEVFGSGAAMKSLNEQLRATTKAAYRWSEFAGAAETASLWSDLGGSLERLESDDWLEPSEAEDRILSAFAAWYLGLPARHRRAIVNSLLGIVFTTCVFIQSVVPHRAPPAILNSMSWLLSLIVLCSAISDAMDDGDR